MADPTLRVLTILIVIVGGMVALILMRSRKRSQELQNAIDRFK